MGVFSILLATTLSPTDFGIREVVGSSRPAPLERQASPRTGARVFNASFSIAAAAAIGGQFGRVTSTFRSVERNQRVGGVANSWHLSGRAMDIARRPGVSHAMIAAELRRNGFHLLESLDEGDHSHFAFGNGLTRPNVRPAVDQVAEIKREVDFFRFILMPRSTGPSPGANARSASR